MKNLKCIAFFVVISHFMFGQADSTSVFDLISKSIHEVRSLEETKLIQQNIFDLLTHQELSDSKSKLEILKRILTQVQKLESKEYYGPFMIQIEEQIKMAIAIDRSELEGENNGTRVLAREAILPDLSEMDGDIIGPSRFDSRIEFNKLDVQNDWDKGAYLNGLQVGVVVEKEFIEKIDNESYWINLNASLRQKFGVCNSVAFSNQPSLGMGTAFLLDSVTLITAGHVLERKLEDYFIVFGYHLLTENKTLSSIVGRRQVFNLGDIEKRIDISELDITALKLSQPLFNNRPPMSLNSNPTTRTRIYGIGHPSGIPKKISLRASVIENEEDWSFFYTTLDAFQGNSGSPVFNLDTHEVIGVLVSGELDYIKRGDCYVDNICMPPYCKGEKVVKIKHIIDYLKAY